MRFVASGAGSLACAGRGLAIFLNVLLTGALDATYFSLDLPSFQVPFGRLQIVALSAIAIVTIVNCASVSVGGRFATALTAVKVGTIVMLGLGALVFAPGNWTNFLLADKEAYAKEWRAQRAAQCRFCRSMLELCGPTTVGTR